MTMKSLLLGAAAGLVTVGAAQAADLPMTKAEAVEYVKVCTEFGEGFFYIPGTDTCLRISGEIRADYRFYDTAGYRQTNAYDFTTEGRVKFDARTQTEYGLLRSFFQINARAGKSGFVGPDGGSDFSIDKAFIQLGGLTAGYAHTFFGIYDNDYGDTIFAPYYTSQSTVNLLAYTATFGGGFSATLSIEDGGEHQAMLDSESIKVLVPDPLNPGIVQEETVTALGYGGKRVPDVVGQLKFEQSWGKVAAFAASHQTTFENENAGSEWGWAAGGSLVVNLPFAGGGWVVVEGVYADGAANYLGSPSYSLNINGNNYSFGAYDYAVSLDGRTDAGTGWSVTGEIGVNVTPALVLVGFGSYVDYSQGTLRGVITAPDFSAYTVGANATYTITPGLTLGAEVSYTNVDVNNSDYKDNVLGGSSDAWQGGLRLKRTF